MILNIYHGSKDIIEEPVYGAGNRYNDYGLGFYCTESIDLAKEWAVEENRDGFVNHYTLDISDLKILDLNSSEYCTLHWISILIQNRQFSTSSPLAYESKEFLIRNYSVDLDEYDVITGYRADDSYFSYAQDFISGAISYRQLSNSMILGNLGNQVVLKSKKSFEKLRFVESEEVESSEWFDKKDKRDRLARKTYFDIERFRRKPGDLFILQIMDEKVTSDDPRLR